jgi:hypothetical protein
MAQARERLASTLYPTGVIRGRRPAMTSAVP